jgi:hypothetical protein
LNHVILLYDARETAEGFEFDAYDPNRADAPVPLRYSRASRAFYFPATHYFAGGPVNVYEIYRGLLY